MLVRADWRDSRTRRDFGGRLYPVSSILLSAISEEEKLTSSDTYLARRVIGPQARRDAVDAQQDRRGALEWGGEEDAWILREQRLLRAEVLHVRPQDRAGMDVARERLDLLGSQRALPHEQLVLDEPAPRLALDLLARLRQRERDAPDVLPAGHDRRLAARYAQARMSDAILRSPDVLVLGGGGVLGEAWMNALLAGLEEEGRLDPRGFGLYIGTSAGSIVAAALVAGIKPATWLGYPREQLVRSEGTPARRSPLWLSIEVAKSAGSTLAAPIASLALPLAAPGGALLRRAALSAMPTGRRSLAELGRAVDRSGVRWDGRLRVAAVQRGSGRRVMFGAPGHREVPVSVAVQASCAIPGFFAPVRCGTHTYVDGGVWSPTNMDTAAVGRGQSVLCLNPTGSLRVAVGSIAGAFGPVSRAVVAAEALALRHRGALVTTINPDKRTAALLGTNLMDHRRRSAVIEAGLAQGRALAAAR